MFLSVAQGPTKNQAGRFGFNACTVATGPGTARATVKAKASGPAI